VIDYEDKRLPILRSWGLKHILDDLDIVNRSLKGYTRNFIAFVNIAGSAYTKIWSLMQDFAGMQPSCVHKRYEITSNRNGYIRTYMYSHIRFISCMWFLSLCKVEIYDKPETIQILHILRGWKGQYTRERS
jgi:hypothetical protein